MTLLRLEPAALRSRVKHSTTEPLHSTGKIYNFMYFERLMPFKRHKIIYFFQKNYFYQTHLFFYLVVTHICQMDFPFIINLKGQFPILGVTGSSFSFINGPYREKPCRQCVRLIDIETILLSYRRQLEY